MTKQTTLKVTGMHCAGCSSSVEKALKDIKGISAVKVDLKGGKATVDYDSELVNEKEMAAAVKKAGFGTG
jgi:P-type Cu+ transporter